MSNLTDPVRRDGPYRVAAMLLSAKDLAHELRVSERTIHRSNSSGRIPRPVRVSGAVRWSRIEIEQWIVGRCPDRATWESTRQGVAK